MDAMNIVLLISELTICYIQIKCWYSIRLRISLTFFTYLIILHSCIEAASWLTMLSLVCSTIKVTGCKSFQLLPILKVDDLSDWYRHHAISLAVPHFEVDFWTLDSNVTLIVSFDSVSISISLVFRKAADVVISRQQFV